MGRPGADGGLTPRPEGNARNTMQTHQHQRLIRLYEALLACDKAILQCDTRDHLFEAVCRNLVDIGGMHLVWIGLLAPGDQRIWPQAHAGEGWNYLDWIRLITHIDQLPGQGVAGAAIAQNQSIWSVDDRHEPPLAGLAGQGDSSYGRSSGAIPLRLDLQPCGVLNIYDQGVHTFDTRTRELLVQLAANIGAALRTQERDAQRKEAEFALLESEVRYNALFASNCMPLIVVDPGDGRVVDANILAMNFYGWDHATITTKHLQDINVLSPGQMREEMVRSAQAKRLYLNCRHRLASGEEREVEVFTSPLSFSGQTFLVSAVHDVTERHLLEAQVHQQQSLMQRFIDQLPGTAFIKDSDLRLKLANQPLADLLGLDPAALVGKTAHEIFPTDFADFVTLLDHEVLEAGASRTFDESFNGRHNETSMFVMEDDAGQRFLGGLSFDVTERFRAKERIDALLRINELGGQLPEKEFLTAGLELAEKLSHSKIGFLHFVNEDQETLELITWTAGALKGCTAAYDIHYPVSQAGIWVDSLRSKKAVIFNDYGAYPDKKGLPAGHAYMSRLITVPVIEGERVRIMLGVGNKESDYTDFDVQTLQLIGNDLWRIARRSRLEAALKQRVDDLELVNQKLADMQLQLLQSEKMASIGQLASGVAHEINNPVGFVKSNLGSLATYVHSLVEVVRAYEAVEHIHGEAVAVALQEIAQRKQAMDYDFLVEDVNKLIDESSDGVQRISQIVLDLKNFSRSGDGSMELADLQHGMESTINVVWHQLKYKVAMVREYGVVPPVRCVASQINQVVMNLLMNAEQAIAGHGTITVRTGCDAANAWFEVQDTGCGIALDKQSRIFEPFYTSKPVGEGTGLGLSISFGIVQRHGGSIRVQSAPGAGSTFRVTLPMNAME
jgi:PAS domain S-box-containing protein